MNRREIRLVEPSAPDAKRLSRGKMSKEIKQLETRCAEQAAEIDTLKKRLAVQKALTPLAHQLHNSALIADVLEAETELSGNTLYAIDRKTGSMRVGTRGSMTAAELVESWRIQHPYLFKDGSSVVTDDEEKARQYFGRGSNPDAANALAKSNLGEYRRLRLVAKRLGVA